MHMDDLAMAPARKAARPPITANPAFPWIVALWFAALLGVGSLILPSAMLERIVVATGIASTFPAIAPPLGFTAKALMALVGTLAGGSLGLFLARRIAAPKTARIGHGKGRQAPIAPRSFEEDELDAEDDHGEVPFRANTGRRRPLAIEEEQGPSDFLNLAPLPGTDDEATGPILAERAPSLETAAEPRDESGHPDDGTENEEPFELDEAAALPEDCAEEAKKPVIAVGYTEPAKARATAAQPQPFSPPSMARVTDDETTDDGAPTQVAAPTFARATETGQESEETVSDKQIFEAPEMPEHEDGQQTAEAGDNGGEAEGLVQLVQRLGSTLEKHREWAAHNAARAEAEAPAPEAIAHEAAPDTPDPVAEPAIPDRFDPAAAEDVSQAMAAYFGAAATALPGPERTFEVPDGADRPRYEPFRGTLAAIEEADDEDDDQELAGLAASFTLPIMKDEEPASIPRPAFDQAPAHRARSSDAESVADVEEDGDRVTAPSLTAANPFKRSHEEFVRIEEPEPEEGDAQPAVLFPNQQARGTVAQASAVSSRAFDPPAGREHGVTQHTDRPRPSNDDNERALREALMNLQRMGK